MVKEYANRAALVLILSLAAISSRAQTIITPVAGVATVDVGTCGQGGGSPNPSCTFKLTLTANATLVFNNVFGGATVGLFINPSTFTLTWPASVPTPPTLTISANNFVSLRYDGTSGTWLVTSGSGGGGGPTTIAATMGDSATGAALTTSEVRYVTIPFSCTIKGWHIMADAGTVTIKVAKVSGGTALPTIASNSISTSGVSLSVGTKVDSTTLTDFTATSIFSGDTLGYFITAVATAKQVTFQLDCQ